MEQLIYSIRHTPILLSQYYNDYIRMKRIQAKSWLLDQKTGKHCKECGSDDASKLDFHHINPAYKTDSISHMLQSYPFPSGYKKAQEEMKKCILLCKSCHRKKNTGRKGEFGVRENARRYPLARCVYLSRWARRGMQLH